jgi:hypothetical protein
LKDTWLKLHTSLLTSAKFVNLPSNDHRWAFVCLLLLAKKGLQSCPENFLLGHLSMGKKRWKTVKKTLIDSGLLDADGSVNGFEESQLTPDAYRKRLERARGKSRDKSKESPLDSRKQRADSREDKNKSATFEKMAPASLENAERLCNVLGQAMVGNDPKVKLPSTQKQKYGWVHDMEMINRIDGREWHEIESVILWSQNDDFWRGNIHSPAKLRKQYTKLLLAMGRKPGRSRAEERQEANKRVLETAIRGIENEGHSKITGSSS